MSTITTNCKVSKAYYSHFKFETFTNGNTVWGSGHYVSKYGVYVSVYSSNGQYASRTEPPSVNLYLRYNGNEYHREHTGTFSDRGLQLLCAAFVKYVMKNHA